MQATKNSIYESLKRKYHDDDEAKSKDDTEKPIQLELEEKGLQRKYLINYLTWLTI